MFNNWGAGFYPFGYLFRQIYLYGNGEFAFEYPRQAYTTIARVFEVLAKDKMKFESFNTIVFYSFEEQDAVPRLVYKDPHSDRSYGIDPFMSPVDIIVIALYGRHLSKLDIYDLVEEGSSHELYNLIKPILGERALCYKSDSREFVFQKLGDIESEEVYKIVPVSRFIEVYKENDFLDFRITVPCDIKKYYRKELGQAGWYYAEYDILEEKDSLSLQEMELAKQYKDMKQMKEFLTNVMSMDMVFFDE